MFSFNPLEQLFGDSGQSMHSRIYTTGIFACTSQYAPYKLQCYNGFELGDYGHVDPATQIFTPHGNILKHPTLADSPDIKERLERLFKEVKKTTNRSRAYSKYFERGKALGGRAQVAEIEELAGLSIKGSWACGTGRRVALLVINPVTYSLKYPGQLGDILDELGEKIKAQTRKKRKRYNLRKFAFITGYETCESYATLVTSGSTEDAHVGFKGEVVPSSGINVGSDMHWFTQGHAGGWSFGSWVGGEQSYTVLLDLKGFDKVFKEDVPVLPISGKR